MVDIVDIDGNVIGSRVRAECHSNKDLIHPVVHFTLYDKSNGTVLMTRRSSTKRFDGSKNCFLGEHVLAGESFVEAVIRGIKEELGYDAKDFREIGEHIFRFENESEFAKFYIAYWNGEELKPDRGESEKEWWMSIKELEKFDENVGGITKFWIEDIDWNCLEN